MFTIRKNVAGAIALQVVACGFLLGQQPPGLDAVELEQRIQDCNKTLHFWQWQANLQIAFVIMVIVFGALITIFQSLNKSWCKLPILVLGGCVAILTGIDAAHVFTADSRTLQRSVFRGHELVLNLNSIANALRQPNADLNGLERQYQTTCTQFTGMQSALLSQNGSKSLLWTKTVYAQSAEPAWVTHPPSDAYNLYSAGIGEDRSITVARQQSFDNAVAGLARQAGPATNCDEVRKIIADSAASDKSYFEFDKTKGVYRYYTLLRSNNTIKNLRCH